VPRLASARRAASASSSGSAQPRRASLPSKSCSSMENRAHILPLPHPSPPSRASSGRQPSRCPTEPRTLTFAQVHHPVLPALRGLVLHREADLLPDQLLPQELASREAPGLEGKKPTSADGSDAAGEAPSPPSPW